MAMRRRGVGDVGACSVPVLFKCPISLELMKDPVTLCTGQTYERWSIGAWLEGGNTTCPATMLQLESLEVVPNHTLRRLIQEWCRRSRGVGDAYPCHGAVKSPVDSERVAALMQEIAGSSGARLGALKELRSIVRDASGERSAQRCVRDAGGVGVITELLASFQESSCGDSKGLLELCEEAVAVLLALVPVCDNEQLRLGLVGCGGVVVASVTSVMCVGSLDSRINVATILSVLASAVDLHFHNGVNVFASLGKLLREDLYPKAVKVSLRVLLALCKHRRNRTIAVEAGVVPALIELLPELQKANAERALCLLDLMCAMAEGRAAVMDHDLAMAVFVSHFHTISVAATECIVSILWLLCQAAPESLAAAQQAGVFAPLLLLLQMECAPKTRHKCGELLKLVKVTGWKEISCDPHFFLPFITTV
ncbi:hypothetical protein M758_8G189800 [Ceratodon purpureus]|nr:hypothetical protein M758_8G189800 [Ceratodon purpureus]